MQRNKYEEFRNDRDLVTVRVLSPEEPVNDMWQLLWSIKRHRDPSGRMPSTSPPFDWYRYLTSD